MTFKLVHIHSSILDWQLYERARVWNMTVFNTTVFKFGVLVTSNSYLSYIASDTLIQARNSIRDNTILSGTIKITKEIIC